MGDCSRRVTKLDEEFLKDRFKPSAKDALGELHNLHVYVDGRFLSGDQAAVSVWDHGLLYGDGTFEGIRAYDGKVFKLDEHIERLFDSAHSLGIGNIPLTRDEMKEAVLRTIRKNSLRDAHIRPIITRGLGRPGLDPRRAVRPSVAILAYPFPPLLGEKPLKLIVSSVRRKSPHSVDSKIKSLSYVDNVLAKIQANIANMDDAIMTDLEGFVAEGTTENLFVVKKEQIYTPWTTACLHGITRATVIEVASEMRYKVEEKNVTVHELYSADEVFLSGTGAGIVPVCEVDGRSVGKICPGRITERIRQAYDKYVRTEHTTDAYQYH